MVKFARSYRTKDDIDDVEKVRKEGFMIVLRVGGG